MKNVRPLERPPSLPLLYARALATARGRRGDRLPETVYALDARAEPDGLAAYDDVCGFRLRDTLPATFPHVLAFPLAMQLMTEADFPFPLPGLVHIANRILQRRALRLGEPLALRVWAENLRPHPRGRQFEIVAEARTGAEVAWRDESTYLRIERRRSTEARPEADEQKLPQRQSAIWRIPAGVGRRYAAVSGDSNPIHLNPWLARLFGFKSAIAHGMWLKARALAALEGRLPDALEVEVEFRSPVLLPSRVVFAAAEEGAGWRFALRDPEGKRIHLVGAAKASSR
ncbi:MAG TPA: MaoC/PaaZ C-terminal domain-containing protein [Candidatus Dormibacteraeota bacterium]